MDGFARTNTDVLIDDRPEDGVFRIDRRIYLDEEIFETEMRNIFEANWQFLCHENGGKPGDYYTTHIGRQPVFVTDKKGDLKAFLNACSHRAATILTPTKQGNAKTLTCRFHGWTYKCDGVCIRIKEEESGYGERFDRSVYDLREIGAVDSFKGFVFGSIKADVEPLEDFFCGSKAFLAFVADQSAAGLRFCQALRPT